MSHPKLKRLSMSELESKCGSLIDENGGLKDEMSDLRATILKMQERIENELDYEDGDGREGSCP